jgi:co-chaperonin GroES (HSP10)
VSVGPGSWTIAGTLVPTTLQEGQKVIVPPMGPTKAEYEGQEYYICSEKLVLAIVD